MPLDWLPEVSSTCAGIGIQLVTVWQSLAQIHEAYGRRADVLLTNHATKLFFPAASDDSTLGYQSKIVGDEEVERRSWSSDIARRRRPPVDLRAGQPRTARPLLPGPPAPLRAGVDDPLQHPAGPGHRPPVVEDPPPRRRWCPTPPTRRRGVDRRPATRPPTGPVDADPDRGRPARPSRRHRRRPPDVDRRRCDQPPARSRARRPHEHRPGRPRRARTDELVDQLTELTSSDDWLNWLARRPPVPPLLAPATRCC